MKNETNKRTKYTFIVLMLVLAISIGYAALTTVLKINSSISVTKAEFLIHFDNVGTVPHKATVTEEAHITNEAKTEISFAATMDLDNYYRFTTDIVNEGSIPGKIKSIELNGLTESQKKFIHYSVKYTESNKVMAIGDYFGPHSGKNITVEVLYKLADDIENDELPTDDMTFDCTFIITFENGNMDEFRARAAANRLMQDVDYFPTSFLNFAYPASTNEHEGIYRLDGTEDDDYPIYFYRGSNANVHNHVSFGGYCWRILRTTNTGGIKIIYNGTPTEDGKCMTLTGNDLIVSNMEMGHTTQWGWNNYNVSPLKTWMSTWYFEHLIKYQAYLEDTPFCNDTSYYIGDISTDCNPDWTISMANGKNNYPIGLISAQEANMAGMGSGETTYPWIYAGTWIMTMSRSGSPTSGWGIQYNKQMITGTGNPAGIRPVVSLNSEVVLSGGDGTQANPYTVSFG